MLGALIGDTIGSVYEFNNIKCKEFPIFRARNRFRDEMHFTDDSVCTMAVANGILDARKTDQDLVETMRKSLYEFGRTYPERGYGGAFRRWFEGPYAEAKPYGSWGNGAVMRVSAAGWLAKSESEAKMLAKASTAPTHNCSESEFWADTVATMIYWLKVGTPKDVVMKRAEQIPELDIDLDEIRPTYRFKVRCRDSVPQAIAAFRDADGFEDTIRTAMSIGGDSDTIAAIAGSLAEACYGVPANFKAAMLAKLKEDRRGKMLATLMREYPEL